MEIRDIIGFTASIIGLLIVIFKLKKNEYRLFKILVITISISGILIFVSNWIFEESIISNIILVLGLVASFSILTIIAWTLRKDPKKKFAAYAWFGALVVIALVAIFVFVVNA